MLNRIEIMGNLVADPELKTTSSGINVCSFRIACERDYVSSVGQREADFVDCVAWREKAEFISKYFSKGMPILVSGRLQMCKWEDRDGNKRTAAEIQAESLYFAGGENRKNKAHRTSPIVFPLKTSTQNSGGTLMTRAFCLFSWYGKAACIDYSGHDTGSLFCLAITA